MYWYEQAFVLCLVVEEAKLDDVDLSDLVDFV